MKARSLTLITICLALASHVVAEPSGGVVTAGSATISHEGLSTHIHQNSGRAVINWQGFDIGSGELVQFAQPGSSAIALNRIRGGSTRIDGRLLANGRIFLVNSSGIVFGSAAQVDVGALLATTSDISTSKFMSGIFDFNASGGGSIVNYGQITVDSNGFVFLVAPSVANHGSIVASAGTVGLHSSGEAFTLDFSGDGLVRYVVASDVEEELSEDSESGNAEGTVVLPQNTGFDVVTSVVNNEGVTEASALVEQDGMMVLQGDPGTLWNSGTIDVSAIDGDTDGGSVRMTGDFVGTDGLVKALGSGTGDGGLVTLESARHTLVTSDARLDVSGGQQGSGGSVLLLSENRSTFNGQIDARGGALQGDGGFVDVSSLGEVEILGTVDASALYGEVGMLLIDPKNIDVNNAGGALYTSGVNNEFNNNAAGDTVISATSINSQTADVLLQANTDITITDAIDLSPNAGVGIALQAGRSVLVNNSITTDGGDVSVTANDPNAVAAQRDAGAASITMAGGTAITAGAGSIELTVDGTGLGTSGGVTAQDLSATGGITVESPGSVALQGTVTGGAVTINSDNDVTTSDTVNASTLDVDAGRAVALNADVTTTGAVNITANSSVADATQHLGGTGGIDMAAGTTLDAGSANIQLTVDAAGNGDAGGVTVDEVTTTGNLTIDSYGAISEADADDDVDVRGDILTLNTQDPAGAMIGAPGPISTDPLEIEVGTRLDMTTQGGYVAVSRPDHTFLDWRPIDDIFTPTFDESQIVDFGLGTVNLGAANLILTVTDGSILDANAGAGAANITATGATLNTDGGEDIINFGIVIGNDGVRGGSIGDAVNPLRTDVDILSATSTDDSIFIQENDEIILSTVEAQQEGVSAKIGGSGVAVRNLRGVNLTGENNVTITAGGSIGVDVVTATDTASLTSAGAITDTNAQLGNITAPTVELAGTDGIGQEPVSEGLALDTGTEALTAISSAGGIFVANNVPGVATITEVTANGGNNVYLQNAQGIMNVGEVTANGGGNVEVNSGGGSIIDGNGATVNITGEDVLVISSFDVGSDLDAIETTATNLEVQMVEEDASFFIEETDGLDSISAQVNNGDTHLTFSGGTFDFDSDTGVFTSGGAKDISLENTGGDVGVGTVSALNTVEIRSSQAITDATSLITTDSVTLAAETGIGAAGSEIQTDVNTLDAQTRNGGIYIRENDGVTATAVATGTGGVVDLFTDNGGDLSVVRIEGKDQVTLDAAGSMVSTSQSGPIRGDTASLTAGGAIGSATDPLATRVSTLTAEANGGGLFVENTGDLTLDTATATGDSLSLRTTGTLALSTVTATGQSVVLHSDGDMTDNNAAAVNVIADSLSISSGGSIGGPGANEAVDVDVSTLTVPKTYGAVYLDSVGTGILALVSAEATGSNADFELNAAGDIDLGSVIAAGDTVSIISTGTIFDANGTDVNVTADSLTIEAPGGIAVGDALETNVNELSSTGNAVISNSGPLALTEASLEGGSSSFIADNITILDIADDLASLQPDVSLSLVTPSGHIVFLDTADTIEASGTGTITIDAGSTTPGSGAVAILGNLVTEDQDITVSADLHITMGLFDAGTGDVQVHSNNGMILDGNGSDVNIIANNVSLRASQPTDREQQLHTINSIADAHAEDSERDALGTLLQANGASASVLAQALQTQIMLRDAKQADLDQITVRVDELTARVAPIATAISVMEQTIQAMTIAADVLNVAGSIAQAIPMTGDGGLLATAAAFETGIGVVDKTLFYTQLTYDILAEDLADLEATQAQLAAELYTHQQVTDAMAQSSSAADEALSIAQAGYDAAVIASAQAWQVSDQSILAEDANNALGTLNQDFGIQAAGDIDAQVDNSSIYLELEGGGTLNNVSATNPATDALISVTSNGDIGVKGAVTGESLVRLDTSAGAVVNDGGTVTASEFLALTTDGVGVDGTGTGGLASSVETFAAQGGTGDILLVNDKDLIIGTVDTVNGLTADGLVSITANSSALTVSQDVDSEADVNLVAGDDTGSTDQKLTVENGVTVSGTGTVTLTSGDDTELKSGSTIEGGNVYIIADNDGATDGVIGGVVADGEITGSLVDIEGGDLKQGGNITSTGIVDIDMTGTVTQDGDINGTTITVDGTDIVQNGDTTGTSVDLNGTSLKQVGNIVSAGFVDIDMTGTITQDGDINGTTITVDGTDIVQNGNTTGTSVDLNGSSLKQVGNIVSTGFVDIDMTGTVTQDGDINGTTITVDGTDIVQNGNTTGTSVDLNGSSLKQVGNIVSTGFVDIDMTGTITQDGDIQGTTITVDGTDIVQNGDTTGTSVDLNGTSLKQVGNIVSAGFVDIDMTGTITQDGDINGTTITVDGTDIVQNGNTTGTSVDLNGSSLKQVGNIVSTGFVDIDMTGTVTQDGDINGTTITVDGTDIVQNGNTTGTSVDLNGTSLKQVGNIVSTGFVDIDMTGTVTQDGDINGTTITVDGTDIVQNGNTTGTSVALTGDSLNQTGDIVSTGAVTIDTTDEVIQSGNVTATSVDIDADGFDHSGTITSTGPVDITTVSTGSSVVDGIKVADIQAAGQTVTLSATGTPTASITDNNGVDRNVLAANLAMTATAEVGTAADSLETEVGRLAADGGTGGVYTDNTGDLLLDDVSGVSAVTATGGAIEVSTTGTISISNGFVQGAGLQVDLTATGGSIVEVSPGPDADVVGDTINLTATGVTNTIGTSTERLEVDGNVLNALTDGGSIFVEDTAGGLSVGEVSTTDFAQNSVVDLLITGGSLLESGSDPDADILGETIKIDVVDAEATIGASATDRIEIDAAILDVTTNEGDIFLEDTDGGVAITSVDTGALGGAASTLDLIAAAGGSITDAADDDGGTPGTDLRAEHILLSVTGGAGNVGADVDHRLEIDADLLDVTTEEGSIFLDDRTGGVTLGALDTGVLGGDESTIDLITHAGGSITDAADDDSTTADVDLRAENLVLTVTGGAGTVGTGSGQRVEIDADVLDVTTEEGSVFLDDRTGGVALGLIETGAPGGVDSTVDLIAHDGGSILDAADDDATTRDIDIRAEQITLAVAGGNGSIGLNDTRRVEIDAEVLDVTTEEGSVFLDDRVGGVALGRIDTGVLGGGASTVDLVSSSGASITDQSSGDSGVAGNDVRAEHILLAVTGGPGGIGLPGEPLELDATLLDIITEGGNIYFEETSGGAAIGQLSTGGGPGTEINILGSGGPLFARNGNDGIADLVAETLSLDMTGSNGSIGGPWMPLEIDAACLRALTEGGSIYLRDLNGGIEVDLVSTTGTPGSTIDLQAVGGSIIEKGADAEPEFISDNLFLDVTGSGSTIGTSSNTMGILVDVLQQATTDGGNIYLLDHDGGVAVGRISTGSGGRVELAAVNGPITDTGGRGVDITTGSVLLRSTGSGNGIGRAGDPLDLDVTTLNGFTSGGSIYLTDLANNVYVDQLSTGGSPGSTISLEARSGSILEAEPRDPGVDVRAGNIQFTVYGEGNSVGTIENPLEISGNQVQTLGGGRTFVVTADGEPLLVLSDTDPTGLILVNGKVVGGADIRVYTQARGTLRPYDLIRTMISAMPDLPADEEMILAPVDGPLE